MLVWKPGSAEGAQGRFTPHDQERWRPFPRQPIFPSLCSPTSPSSRLRQCWRWSSLISPEPTGLFFHLRIPPSRRRGRSAFHIFCLFKSLAAFQSVHFLPLCRGAVSLSWPRLSSLSARHSCAMQSFSAPPCLGLSRLLGAHRCQLFVTVWLNRRREKLILVRFLACGSFFSGSFLEILVCLSKLQVSRSHHWWTGYSDALVQVL